MVQAAITRNKIESYAYENILSIIDDRTKIPDPRNSTTRQFVYNSDPMAKALGFEGMPYIILKFPTFEMSNRTSDGKHAKVMWRQEIVIRTVKDGSSNSTVNQGKSDMFAIGDALVSTFNSLVTRNTLYNLNMSFCDIKKLSFTDDELHNQIIYESVYELTYWTRMVISA